MAKRALITGITGQDGSYLAELLLGKGYEVHGIVRRASTTNYWRIEHLLERMQLHPADLLDQLSLIRVIDSVRPHEFYNLAAMSFVPASWDQPMLTGEFNSQGVTRALEAMRQVGVALRPDVARRRPGRLRDRLLRPSGTYVRSLIGDLGDAYCLELRRTAIGPFDVGDADPEHVIPLQDALRFSPRCGWPATRPGVRGTASRWPGRPPARTSGSRTPTA